MSCPARGYGTALDQEALYFNLDREPLTGVRNTLSAAAFLVCAQRRECRLRLCSHQGRAGLRVQNESFGAFAARMRSRGARCGHIRVDPLQQTRGTMDFFPARGESLTS